MLRAKASQLLLLSAALVTLGSSASGAALFRNVSVPVPLAEGQPADQQLSARLCEPGDIRVPVFLTIGELDTLFCGRRSGERRAPASRS